MPRSVKDLREALAELPTPQLRALMLAEAKTNIVFAGAVFAAFDRELSQRLNNSCDFGFLVDEVQRELISARIRGAKGGKDSMVERVKGVVDQVGIACA